MKKISVIFIIIAITLFTIIFYLDTNKSDDYIIKKGYKLFGEDICPITNDMSVEEIIKDNEHFYSSSPAFCKYRCKLCNKQYTSDYTPGPIFCSKCRTITNRCSKCGKLKNEV